MAIVHIMPLKEFYYAADGIHALLYGPGTDEHGNPNIFDFADHQAENIVKQGWGEIVQVRKNIVLPDDPVLKAAYEEKLAQIAKHEADQAPSIAEGMTAFQSAPPATIVVQAAPTETASPAPAGRRGRQFKAT